MIVELIVTGFPTGGAIFVFSNGNSLGNYVSEKVAFVEDAAPNLGRYRCNWDTADGTSLAVFEGATQPASWEDAIPGLEFDLNTDIATEQTTAASIKAATRSALNGVWRDEFDKGFTNTVTDP
jgi:hypothetical protein